MEVIYGLLPAMIVVGLAMAGILAWAIYSGQYDDMEGPPSRILHDDDDEMIPKPEIKNKDGKK